MSDSTNPKDKLGRQKPPLHLVPASANIAEAGVFALGAAKYGPFNWREHSVSASVYVSALYRHMAQWFDGEDIDGESGESHLAHARACLGILLDAKACNKLVDDRPLKGGASQEIKSRLAAVRVQDFYDKLPEEKKEYVTDHNADVAERRRTADLDEANLLEDQVYAAALGYGPVTLTEDQGVIATHWKSERNTSYDYSQGEHLDAAPNGQREFARGVLSCGIVEHIGIGEEFILIGNTGTAEAMVRKRLMPVRKIMLPGWTNLFPGYTGKAANKLYPGNVLNAVGWETEKRVIVRR